MPCLSWHWLVVHYDAAPHSYNMQRCVHDNIMPACRYAELNGDTRSFTPEEEDLFDRSAEFAYASFRDKAAESRGMPIEELQKHAQGRVWSGTRALQNGLVDCLGGIDRAISIAKQEAGIGKQAAY